MTTAEYTAEQMEARDRAHEAKDRLLELVADFGLQSPLDRVAWLAGLLTVIAGSLCRPTPLFVLSGASPGCGKGLLYDLVAIIATGRRGPRLRPAMGEADQRHQVLTVAQTETALVLIDSVVRPLGSAKLDEALTSPSWLVRRAGEKEVRVLPLPTVWWAAGNSVRFDPRHDTERRAILICVGGHGQVAGPQITSALDYAEGNRGVLASDARAILDGWRACKGAHLEPLVPPWGSFEDWSSSVRSALVWLCLHDPVLARPDKRAEHRGVRPDRLGGHP